MPGPSYKAKTTPWVNGIKKRGQDPVTRLIYFDKICRFHGLQTWQWIGKNSRSNITGHSEGSWHYQQFPGSRFGMAFDAFGSVSNMRACVAFIEAKRLKRYLYEGIFQAPGRNLSVKRGINIPPSNWGTKCWNDHKDHIHIAIKPKPW